MEKISDIKDELYSILNMWDFIYECIGSKSEFNHLKFLGFNPVQPHFVLLMNLVDEDNDHKYKHFLIASSKPFLIDIYLNMLDKFKELNHTPKGIYNADELKELETVFLFSEYMFSEVSKNDLTPGL